MNQSTSTPVNTVALLRDGKVVGTFIDDSGAMAYVHRTHSYSFFHALRHEGYSVQVLAPEASA
jgi:hypothetical protein